MKPIILIPSRMASTRLPGKPLAEIAGLAMIGHVLKRALEADIAPVVVAADDERIRDVVEAAGGRCVMTRADHSTGSDRIFEALQTIDPDQEIDCVINVQGDLPTIEPACVRAVFDLLQYDDVDISTVAAAIIHDDEKTNENVVKVVGTPLADRRLRALYFTRATAPHGDGPLYHHIGLYGYKRSALTRFVSLKPSPLETRERLEQLRALEAGMRIDVGLVDTVPLGVDTPADLEKARAVLAPD
ncbi:MAG: 3-deoxy-manno-octulosonate cytidylyltransferase [Pseudomonadota bacterium]